MPSKLTLSLSVVVHVLVAARLLLPADVSPVETPPEMAIVLESKLAEDAVHQQPEEQELPPENPAPERQPEEVPSEEEPPAIKYAGAPGPVAKAEAPAEEEARPSELDTGLETVGLEQPKPEALPEETIETDQTLTPVPSETELAIAVDKLKEGLDAPRATFGSLSIEDIEAIAKAGQGLILARCEGRHYVVSGELAKPRDLTQLTDRQAERLSARGLFIAATRCGAVREQLRWDHGYDRTQVSRCKVLLMFTSRLDHLILWRQKEAAGKAGVGLEAVRETMGKFRWSGGRVVDFRVLTLTRKDGGASTHRLIGSKEANAGHLASKERR